MLPADVTLSKQGICALVVIVVVGVAYFQGVSLREMVFLKASTSAEEICLEELLIAAVESARRGGVLVKEIKQTKNLQEKSKGNTKEGVNDPVTLGDTLSNRQMYYSLRKTFPRLPIVSEEKSNEVSLDDVTKISLTNDDISSKLVNTNDVKVPIEDVTVWIDPLDATKEYTENLTEYVTTMVCVAVKGKAVIGVINLPFEDKLVWSWVDHGRSEIPHFEDSTTNSQKKIIVSRSHQGKVKSVASEVFGEGAEIIPAGGAGYKALYVAQHRADAYIHTTAIKKWDICAGNALLRQSGGDMTDLQGNAIDYIHPDAQQENVVLKNGLLATYQNHQQFVDMLKNKSFP